jgi:GH15 family glucan-1,4-alpha-glucosidase
MSSRIEDYAVIGDLQTAALVGSDGSIDWLCLPRFDSGACFATLLGDERHGRWRLAPAGSEGATHRRYRDDTLILETEWQTAGGAVRVIDYMPPRRKQPDVVRIVEGLGGRVAMRMELTIRFDYGHMKPWIHVIRGNIRAASGPDALELRIPVEHREQDRRIVAEFNVSKGDRVPFVLTWHPSYVDTPDPIDPERALADTERFWRGWSARCTYNGRWREPVMRSLLTLKALTYQPTGGIIAALTTSLPEDPGGVRNWDYRYCWLRDATITLAALLLGGYVDEARDWREWLLRAAAGDPSQLRIMYGPAGEPRVPETELRWLPGYERSTPVRVGNAAGDQRQLDVFGELMDALHQARRLGIEPEPSAWDLQRSVVDFVERTWNEPDEGLWEVRTPRRQFTHSKVLAWVALDRAVRSVEELGLPGPARRWRATRDEIRLQVLREGYDAGRHTFTQSYGSKELDASLLLLPSYGFLPATDPRMRGTVAAIERGLLVDGFVWRYRTGEFASVDGLSGGEGAFLACTFWLADAYARMGRGTEARELFERLLELRNDVGLLSEEYDPVAKRLLGNFPQAFSHVALINTALHLDRRLAPEHVRADPRPPEPPEP